MRLGILEFGTVIVILLIAFLVARAVRGSKNSYKKEGEIIAGQTIDGEEKTREKRQRTLKHIGIGFVAFAVITVFACVSLFRWLIWGYAVFFLALAIGLVLLYISRKA